FFRANGVAGELRGAVGDDLVGVHVRRCAGAGLKNIDGKMRAEPAVDDLARGLLDETAFFGTEAAELLVGQRASELHQAEATEEAFRHRPAADGKVEHGALGGSTVE